jgi:hypothetical protein
MVRFPIALATPWLSAPRVATSFDIDIEAHAPPGNDQLIVDVFHDGHWIHTETMASGREIISVPDSRPGLYLLEARADPYGGERVAARYVLVSPDSDSPSLEQAHSLLSQAGMELADAPSVGPRMVRSGSALRSSCSSSCAAVSGLLPRPKPSCRKPGIPRRKAALTGFAWPFRSWPSWAAWPWRFSLAPQFFSRAPR